jgi:hypothetical protein
MPYLHLTIDVDGESLFVVDRPPLPESPTELESLGPLTWLSLARDGVLDMPRWKSVVQATFHS